MKRLLPKLLVLVLLAGGAGSIMLLGEPVVETVPDVVQHLPDVVGTWRGAEIFFCQNVACLHSFSVRQLDGAGRCPDCGGELRSAWSAAETRLLPPDTVLLKKVYTDPTGRQLRVSVVISGREHVSIHRPQLCLVGQGFRITGDQVADLAPAPNESLAVNVLRLRPAHRAPGDGSPLFYAYWFVGGGRVTASDWARIGYAAWDRLVHNRIDRWSYIAVSGVGRAEDSGLNAAAARFIEQLAPMLTTPREVR